MLDLVARYKHFIKDFRVFLYEHSDVRLGFCM
jgi:hypothetical protein